MSTKKHSYNNDKAISKQRAPKPVTENLELTQQQTHPDTLIRRANLSPSSLTSGNVLQLQRTIGNRAVRRLLDQTAQRQPTQTKENDTGLPDNLKSGIESLSGMPMDDVNVHYNSSKPAGLQALAYTQGTDIYVGTGQETHLPHEAWHVVQQKQGRVQPTLQMKDAEINDSSSLEREADTMGTEALATSNSCGNAGGSNNNYTLKANRSVKGNKQAAHPHSTIQLVVQSKVSPLKKGGFQKKFYSTYDTKTEFDKESDAWEHDKKLGKEKESTFDPYARYPTIFSYYNTEGRNVMGNSKQGPHTLSHSSLSHRFKKRVQDTDLTTLRDNQVLTKEDFKKDFQNEKPNNLKSDQMERALLDYGLLYDELDELLKKGSKEKRVHELIMRLMQMNPYSAYGKGNKVSRSRIKGKGERKEDKFSDAFDTNAKFNSEEGYENFKKKRKELYSSDEETEEEKLPKKKLEVESDTEEEEKEEEEKEF